MPISVTCPTCAGRVRLPDNAAGRRFRCPKCKGVIPGPPKPAPPAPAPVHGFVDEPGDPSPESPPAEGPIPISAAARKAIDEPFNPFADPSAPAETEDEERPNKKRYWKPKDDYNPFAEPPPAGPAGGAADSAELFDFGGPEAADAPPPPAGDLDFGPPDPPPDGPRRRRK